MMSINPQIIGVTVQERIEDICVVVAPCPGTTNDRNIGINIILVDVIPNDELTSVGLSQARSDYYIHNRGKRENSR